MDIHRMHFALRGKQMRIIELEHALATEKKKSRNQNIQVAQEVQMTARKSQGSDPSIQVQPKSLRYQSIVQSVNSTQVSNVSGQSQHTREEHERTSIPQQQQRVSVPQWSSPHSSSSFGSQNNSSRPLNQRMKQFSSQPQLSTNLVSSVTKANPQENSHAQISQHSNEPSSSSSLQNAQTNPHRLPGQQHSSQSTSLPQHMDNPTINLYYKPMQRYAHSEKRFVATSQNLQPISRVQAPAVQQHSFVISQNTTGSASQYHQEMHYSLKQTQQSQVSWAHSRQPSWNPPNTQQNAALSSNEMQIVRQRLPVTQQPVCAPLYPQQVSQPSHQPTHTQQRTEKNMYTERPLPPQNMCSPHQPQPATSTLHHTLEDQQCFNKATVSLQRDVHCMTSQRFLAPQQPVYGHLQPQQSLQHSSHDHIPTHHNIDNGSTSSQSSKIQPVTLRLPLPCQSVPVSHRLQQGVQGPLQQPASSPLQSHQTLKELLSQTGSEYNANKIVSQELPVPNQLGQVTSKPQQTVQEPNQEVPTIQNGTKNYKIPYNPIPIQRLQVSQKFVQPLTRHNRPKPQSVQISKHLISKYQVNHNDPQTPPHQTTPGHQNMNYTHVQSSHSSEHNVARQQFPQSERPLFAAIQELLDSPESYQIDKTSRKLLHEVNDQASHVTCGQKETSKDTDVQIISEQQIDCPSENRRSPHGNVHSLSRCDDTSNVQSSFDRAPTFQKPTSACNKREIRELEQTSPLDKNVASNVSLGNIDTSSSQNKYDMLCKRLISKESPFEKIIKEESLPLWSKGHLQDHGDCQIESVGNLEVEESMNVSEFLSACVGHDVSLNRQNAVKEDCQKSAVGNYVHTVITGTAPQMPPAPSTSKMVVCPSVDLPTPVCSLPQNSFNDSENQENILHCTNVDKEDVNDMAVISSEGESQSSGRTEDMVLQTIERTSALLVSNVMEQSSISMEIVSSSVDSCAFKAIKLSNSQESTSNSSLTDPHFQQSKNVEHLCDYTHVSENDIMDLTKDSEDGSQSLTSTEVIPVKTMGHSDNLLGLIAISESDDSEIQVVTSTAESHSSSMPSLNDALSPCNMLPEFGEIAHSSTHDDENNGRTSRCQSKINCDPDISRPLAERKSVESSGSPDNVDLLNVSVESSSTSVEVDRVCGRTSSIEHQERCNTDVDTIQVVTKNPVCKSDVKISDVIKNPVSTFFRLKTDHSEEMVVGDRKIEYFDDEIAVCVQDIEKIDEELDSTEEYWMGDDDISEKSASFEQDNSTEDLLESHAFDTESVKQNFAQDKFASTSEKQENCVKSSTFSCTSSFSNTSKGKMEVESSISDNHLIIHVVIDKDTGKMSTEQKIPEECPMCYTPFHVSDFSVLVPDYITGIKYVCTRCKLNISMVFVTSVKFESYEMPKPKRKKRKLF